MTSINELPAEVKDYLLIHIRARRRIALAGALSIAAAYAFIWTLLWCMVDRFAHLSQSTRGLLLVLAVIGICAWLYRPLRRVMEQQIDLNTAAEDIERLRPDFDEKLETICSRLLGPQEHRGSVEILGSLASDVSSQISSSPRKPLVDWRQIRGRLITLGVIFLTIIVLSVVPIIGLPRLMARFAAPWAAIPPVTTTQLTLLDPSGPEVNAKEGQTVNISVHARRLGDSTVRLHCSTDGKTWVERTMDPKGESTFTGTVGPIDKDQWFYITGGDATTGTLPVRVLRKPAITEFRVRYEYPAYTQRPALAVQNTDGLIEAPIGSKATLTIVATEPLQSASIKLDGADVALQPTVEPAVYQATLTVTKDQPYRIAMLSRRNMAGEGPSGSVIRAIPDRAPFVQLVQPAEDMRLNPRDLTALAYQAGDDYGLTDLTVQVQVNGANPADLPARLTGDPRKQEGSYALDLAKFPLKIGDIVSVTIAAKDASGQSAVTLPRHIFIAPQSVNLASQMRQVDLEQARNLTDRLLKDLESSASAMDEARRQSDKQGEKFAAAQNRYQQNVATGGEDAAALKQQLLRAINQSDDAGDSDLLTGMLDKAQTRVAESRALAGELEKDATRQDAARRTITQAISQTRHMQQQLKTLTDGEKAAQTLADLRNVQAAEQMLADNRQNPLSAQMTQRLKDNIADNAKDLSLDPADPNLKTQLEKKVREANQLARQARPLDLTPPAREWADHLQAQPADASTTLAQRINATAEAETVRPDGDLKKADDLETAARAARAIEEMAQDPSAQTREVTNKAAQEFPQALDAIQKQPRNQQPTNSPEAVAAAAAADQARKQMQQWAGDTDQAAGPQPPQPAQPTERAVMDANAEMARGQYDKAAQIDKTLAMPPDKAAEAAEAMTQAQRVDQVADSQRQLAMELDQAAQKNAGDLADKQQKLAQEIGQAGEQTQDNKTSPRDTRAEAMAAIQQSQERLAAMPQQLQQTARAADVQFQAAELAARAQQDATAAQGDRKAAAQHAAERGTAAADDARQRTAETQPPVSPEVPKVMADNLQEYAPDTSAAVTTLKEKLAPALADLKQAIDANDAKATTRQLARAREAIAVAQEDLRNAQASVLDQDPLFAAQAYAQTAAKSLQQTPPDLPGARQAQAQAAKALSQAWNQSIHQAADARMASVPSMSSVYSPQAASTAAVAAAADFSTLREWGRLRQRDKEELTTTSKQEDPGGYRQMLQIYFETLGKAEGAEK